MTNAHVRLNTSRFINHYSNKHSHHFIVDIWLIGFGIISLEGIRISKASKQYMSMNVLKFIMKWSSSQDLTVKCGRFLKFLSEYL